MENAFSLPRAPKHRLVELSLSRGEYLAKDEGLSGQLILDLRMGRRYEFVDLVHPRILTRELMKLGATREQALEKRILLSDTSKGNRRLSKQIYHVLYHFAQQDAPVDPNEAAALRRSYRFFKRSKMVGVMAATSIAAAELWATELFGPKGTGLAVGILGTAAVGWLGRQLGQLRRGEPICRLSPFMSSSLGRGMLEWDARRHKPRGNLLILKHRWPGSQQADTDQQKESAGKTSRVRKRVNPNNQRRNRPRSRR